MKIALVHELLTMRGGAEYVLKILAEMYPDAPIYTLLYNEKKLGDWFPKERIRTSSLQKTAQKLSAFSFQLSAIPFNHHLYLNKMPAAVEAWDFSEYDIVLSVSSAFAHGIITNGKPKHISYINAPARYLWDRTHDVLERSSTGLLGPLKKRYLQKTFHRLRIWDAEAAARADTVIAASKDVERRIELYWRRDSEVITPPVDDFWLEPSTRLLEYSSNRPYFLVVSTLVPYKRIDIAIKACNVLGLHLKIVGEGPHARSLKKIAGPTIEFLGYRTKEELRDLYTNARALIVPGEEDFCLAVLESMACGTPVISYRAGGPLETILEGKTGEFFEKQESESLQMVLQKYDQKKYSYDVCRARAKEFSRTKFEVNIRTAVDALCE